MNGYDCGFCHYEHERRKRRSTRSLKESSSEWTAQAAAVRGSLARLPAPVAPAFAMQQSGFAQLLPVAHQPAPMLQAMPLGFQAIQFFGPPMVASQPMLAGQQGPAGMQVICQAPGGIGQWLQPMPQLAPTQPMPMMVAAGSFGNSGLMQPPWSFVNGAHLQHQQPLRGGTQVISLEPACLHR